jgi:rare lipoprotein A
MPAPVFSRDAMRGLLVLTAVLLLFALPGCAKKKIASAPPPETVVRPAPVPPKAPKGTYKPYVIRGKKYYPLAQSDGFVQDGVASWYGRDFHGKKTANGETYNMYAMTAAHKILPMNTRIRVVNLENGKSAILRINDRGPFVGDRILDCSYKSAQALGFADKGLARIRLEAVPEPGVNVARAVENGRYYVQVGSFTVRDNAERMLSQLKSWGYGGSRIQRASVRGERFYRVQAGVFQGLSAVEQARTRLAGEYPAGFIVAD